MCVSVNTDWGHCAHSQGIEHQNDPKNYVVFDASDTTVRQSNITIIHCKLTIAQCNPTVRPV